jgi:hypothetical protein
MGGALDSGLDSSLSRNDLNFPAPGGPAPVGVPYPYVPLQFIVEPTASKPAIPFQSLPNSSPEKKSPPDVKFSADRNIASNSNNGVGILFLWRRSSTATYRTSDLYPMQYPPYNMGRLGGLIRMWLTTNAKAQG